MRWLTCLAALAACAHPPEPRAPPASLPPYHWSPNIAVAPPEAGHQKAETALAADRDGRVWLAYLDASYRKLRDTWLDFPRQVMLAESPDDGATFGTPVVLSASGTDEDLLATSDGRLLAAWVDWTEGMHGRIVVRETDRSPEPCLLPTAAFHLDQASLAEGPDGVIYVAGTGLAEPRTMAKDPLHVPMPVFFARRDACGDPKQLAGVGAHPQVAPTLEGTLVMGVSGFVSSADGHASAHAFGRRGARVAVGPDQKTLYVVGDSASGGLFLQSTPNLGKTWRQTRVDFHERATAWNFPALAVDPHGRIHVVWMDDEESGGAVFHAYSDDGGASFSPASRVSDHPFPFPAAAPPPAPANQEGTWIGDYLAVALRGGTVIVAWSDQRAGPTLSGVYVARGAPQ